MRRLVARSKIVSVYLAGLVVCCVVADVVGMSAQAANGAVEGTIHDTTGGIMAGASVMLREVDTNLSRMAVADVQGRFRFAEVPVGTYEVRVDYDGFTRYVHDGIIMTIGRTARLDVSMRPAGVLESVAVSAQPRVLDPRQTSTAATIDAERIEELPVRSRNYLEFVLLAPGVSPSASIRTGSAGSVLPDSGFSFGGLRPRSNSLTIDGLDNNDEFTGSSRTELSLEIVREFQVVSSGWSVEHGGAAGGGINVVTKSGANTTHGDAFLFAQSGVLNARPKLEETLGEKPSQRRLRGGVAVGGPVVKERTFYYAAAEREESRDQSASDTDPAAVSAINSALRGGVLPETGTRHLTAGLFPTSRTETEWSAKVTRQIAGRGPLVARIAGTDNHDEREAFNNGGLSDRSARGTEHTRDVAFTGSWSAALGAGTTNELRGQLATRRLDLQASDQAGAGVSIAGVADFGYGYFGTSTHHQTYIEIGDTVGHSRGAHFLKAGADVRHVALSGTTADGTYGLYVFRTLDSFLTGEPDAKRQTSARGDVDFAVTRASGFVQDHWTPAAEVTVDAGLRFDASSFPSSLGISNRQVSPRVGVAWMPRSSWVFRGGAGLFPDRIVLAAVERAWLTQHRNITELVTEQSITAAPSIYTVRQGTWNPSSRQASVGAERQLSSNLTASVSYLFVQGRHLPRTTNVNLPAPTPLTVANASSMGIDAPVPQQLGRPVFGRDRLDPEWDGIFEMQPTAASAYHGVTMALNRRLAHEVEWAAAYTWSHARDSASDYDEQPQNPYALADEWSDSRYDQPHRFVLSALFDLPVGDEDDRRAGDPPPGEWIRAFSHIEAAPILTVGSGHPVNVLTGGDDNRTGAFPFTSRPLDASRNMWRLPASATLDLRLLKYFNIQPHGKLDFVVECFNVLNRTNVTQVNTTYGQAREPPAGFGRATEAGAARQFQFSVDYEF